mgnify:CR=1 FL=1
MLKKVLKGLGIFLLVTIIALAAAPFLFKDKIKEMIAKTLNENVNANIAFEDVDLSLFKSFPQAHVTIDKLSIVNKVPFAGDTLLYAGETNVTMSVKELFKGAVIVIDEIKLDNIAVHSRIIRDYIKNGDIKMANKLLGKKYKIYGQKIKGQGLGAKSFVPTINLKVDEFLLPNEGVYITKTILDEQEFNSITFLGHRFTTDGSYAVETHILDRDIEDKDYTTQIKFCEKLRENKKFDSFEELKNQILDDIKSAKNYFINIY